MKKVTITDVAKEAGLSIGAISKVLNGLSVRPATKEKVEKAIKKTGYTPNAFARGIRSSAKGNIGILTTPSLHNNWVRELIFEIINCSLDRNVNFIVETVEPNSSSLPRLLSLVDGLLLLSGFNEEFYKNLENMGAPPVVTFGDMPNYSNASTLTINNVLAGKQLTNHLILMGHRRIGFITLTSGSGVKRLAGYKEVLTECFGKVDEDLILEADSYKSKRDVDTGYELGKELLNKPNPPTAIIFASDYMASGGFTAAAEKNLLVPQDISIASFSGVKGNVETRPELTSVAYDNALLAEKFLDTFDKQTKLKRPGQEYIVDTVFLDKQHSVLNLNLNSI